MPTAKRVCLSLLLMLMLLMVCGCPLNAVSSVGSPSQRTIEREVNTDGRSMVVIPFKDARHPYFESDDGSELTERVVNEMRRHMRKTRLVSSLPVRDKFDPAGMEKVGVDELGKVARADLVLVGDLKEFSTSEPKTVGMLRGTCRIEIVLFDAQKKERIWTRSLTIHYPDYGPGVPATDTTPEKIRTGLMKLSGDVIAKKFYTHKRMFATSRMEW